MRLNGLKSAELNGATGYLGDRKDLAEARVNIHLIDATAPNGGKAVAVRIENVSAPEEPKNVREDIFESLHALDESGVIMAASAIRWGRGRPKHERRSTNREPRTGRSVLSNRWQSNRSKA